MNFDFSEEQNLFREQARRFLADSAEGKAEILEGEDRSTETFGAAGGTRLDGNRHSRRISGIDESRRSMCLG